jgi:hypothetical protein
MPSARPASAALVLFAAYSADRSEEDRGQHHDEANLSPAGGASHGCIGRVSVMLNEVKECATKDICTQTLIERSAIGPRVGRVWDALSLKVVEEAAT